MKKTKNNRRRKKSPTPDQVVSSRQIRTTVDFGGEGVQLEFLWTVKEAAKRQHRTLLDRLADAAFSATDGSCDLVHAYRSSGWCVWGDLRSQPSLVRS